MIRTLIGLGLGVQLVFAVAVNGAQTARDATTLDRVLDRMASALGGRDRLARIQNVRSKFRLQTAGIEGTGESISTAKGERRTFFELSGVTGSLDVFDGTQSWERDLNGKVRERMGAELQRDVTAGYLESFSFLVPGRRTGTVDLKGEDSEGKHYVLVAKGIGGSEVTLFVEKSTFLVARQESPNDDRNSTTTLSDWREVDGVKFPFKSVRHDGPSADAKYDATVTITELATNVAVAPTAFAKPEEGAADYRFAKGSSALGIPFELNSNHIFVQVTLNGAGPLWFLFDTGAEATAIDDAAAKRLGLASQGTLEARGSGEGSMDASIVKGVTLGMRGAEVVGQTVYALPLGQIAAFEGRPIDGIIGYDFTSRFVVEIDYANRTMNLFEPKTYAYKGAGARLPVAFVGNIPYVHATMVTPTGALADGLFMVDTGSRLSISLNAPFVRATPWASELATRSVSAPYGMGIGGESKARVGRLGGLRLGRYEVKRPVTGLSFDESGADASSSSTGAIGGDVLRRFDVVFDYSRAEMIVTPNASLDEPSEYDMLGALLSTDGHGAFVVRRVVERSAADAAGLAPGDAITAIDGTPAAELSLEQLRAILRVDGRPLRLAVRRGDEMREVKLTLKRIV